MKRKTYIDEIATHLDQYPVVAILGPRQCGKTTLSRQYVDLIATPKQNIFDLQDPQDLSRLQNPKLTLSELHGLVIIDEIQYLPDLFPIIRVLVDRNKNDLKFLILGSASRDLILQSSETLAGRIHYIELTPFKLFETRNTKQLWLRGGFPKSYLAKNEKISATWRKDYIRTFLERDIRQLGFNVPTQTIHKFWIMLSHYHGEIFNASEIGNALGVASTTMRRYLDILTGTFMVRELAPWHENVKKRQVKSPKIYFKDSGIYHTLSNIATYEDLQLNPKLGTSWEGMALEEIITRHNAYNDEVYFWAIHGQAELDLLIVKDGKRLGFEIKYSEKPSVTKSMKIANEILKLDSLTIITPGQHNYPIDNNIRVIDLLSYIESLSQL